MIEENEWEAESDVREYPEINAFCSVFNMEQEVRLSILKKFTKAMDMGLSDDSEIRAKSSLKMLPTYVTKVMRNDIAKSNKTHYAVDLGGTNLRVLFIRYIEDKVSVTARNEELSLELINGPAVCIFDKIADFLALIAHSNQIETSASFNEMHNTSIGEISEIIDLGVVGFTFSFPTQQESLYSGKLIHWTKGYTASGAVGENVAKMLLDAIQKHPDITAEKVAILNDTTGTMLCGAVERGNVVAGLIQGTGCNACYLETTSKIMKLGAEEKGASEHMIINTEMGAFGDKGELKCIKTEQDISLDKESNNIGSQTMEKMVSGLYICELVRLCLFDMKQKGLAFVNDDLSKLKEKNSFTSLEMSSVEDGDTENILQKFSISTDPRNVYALASVCRAIVIRCAKLVAVSMVALLSRSSHNRKTIAADGSVITKHPTMKSEILSVMKNLQPAWSVTIHLTSDGSGKGAGILASML